MQFCFSFILVFLVGVNADQPRIYDNPLNGKSVDLFLVVDEANSRLNQVQLGQMKIALKAIVADLYPPGSTPFFGVFFYGATSSVQTVVPFGTTSATAVNANLDLKQYTTAQTSPSTLTSALDSVDASCRSKCRTGVPRVTVVLTSSPDSSAEFRVRQLENIHSMTVIVVGIGHIANTAALYQLPSHPSRTYGVPFDSYTELIVSAPFISILISNVPRLLTVGTTLNLSNTHDGLYYTVQLNTFEYIKTDDTVITFTTNCKECPIFSALSEPNPTSGNAVQNGNPQYFYAPGYTYSVYYFRIPNGAKRFFLSFLGNGMPSVTGIFNVFSMPPMMSFP